MSLKICPQCGGMLLGSDAGDCPVCRIQVEPIELSNAAPNPVQVVETDLTFLGARPGEPAALVFEPEHELLFQTVRAELEMPQKGSGNWLIFAFLSVVAFVVSKQGQPARDIAILVGIIFFHEMGHWLGMQAFGYRDVKMFFLPFFGAAVSGKKEGAPQWQQAIVALLGPMPGIVVGCGLMIWNVTVQNLVVAEIIKWLLILNIFNLLPLMPLDGGRFLNAVIFSRHRVLEALFLLLTSAAVIGLGVWIKAYVFAGVGAMGLLMIPYRFRVAGIAAKARKRWAAWSPRLADSSDAQLRDLFREARQLLARNPKANVASYVNAMRSIHEIAQVQPVTLLASLGLLMIYVGGIALPFVSYTIGILRARLA